MVGGGRLREGRREKGGVPGFCGRQSPTEGGSNSKGGSWGPRAQTYTARGG